MFALGACVVVPLDSRAAEPAIPTFATVAKTHPLPGTKRIYLQQPCDYKIVQARPDFKLQIKDATAPGDITGVGFALLDGATIQSFDFAKTRQEFAQHALPLLKQTVVQAGAEFEQTAFTTTATGRPLLLVRLRIRPEPKQPAHKMQLVWLAVRQPHQRFQSHGNEDYIVFEPWGPAWDAGLQLRYENGVLYDSDTIFAVVHGTENVTIVPGDGPKCALQLMLSFDQAQEAVIELAIPYEGRQTPPDAKDQGQRLRAAKAFRRGEETALASLSFAGEYARQGVLWQKRLDDAAKIAVPEAVVQDIYRTLTLNDLQFLGSAPGAAYCRPGQGGFNNFSVVYGWESSHLLTMMDRQGFHAEVRRVLDYFLTTQQGTHGPTGDISTAEGCFHPHIHWMCETGAVLRVFAEHALCSGNLAELRHDSPALLKAARWIQGQRARTKQLDANGQKPPHFGLMPPGRATDWPDSGYFFFTDAYTWQGLDRLARAYEAAQLPEAQWLRAEADDYRQCILDAVRRAIKPHPLDSALQWVPDQVYEDPAKALPTTIYTGPQGLLGAGVLAADDPLVPAIEKSLRRAGCMSDLFAFRMRTMEDAELKRRQEASAGGKIDLYYVGNCERMWHRIWLERGERGKALRYFYSTLAYAVSRDVHVAQERYCPQLPWLLPWQPNASGNGRVLEMIFNALLFEKGDALCVLYGAPDAWFAARQPLGVTNLCTSFGRISFRLTPADKPGAYRFAYECTGRAPRKFLVAVPTGAGAEQRRIVEIAAEGKSSAAQTIP